MELRDFAPDDDKTLAGWIGDIDPGTTPAVWLAAAVAETQAAQRDRFTRAVVVDGRVVGAVLLSIDSAADARAEVGFVVDPNHRRAGIAANALVLVCDEAFNTMRLHRLWGVCDPANAGAVAVFERNRFELEGRLVHDRRVGNGWHDSLIFGRVASE